MTDLMDMVTGGNKKPTPKKKVKSASEPASVKPVSDSTSSDVKKPKKAGRPKGSLTKGKVYSSKKVRIPSELRKKYKAIDKLTMYDSLKKSNKFLQGCPEKNQGDVKRIVVEFSEETFNVIRDKMNEDGLKLAEVVRQYLVDDYVPNKVKEEWVIQVMAGLR